MHLTPRLPNVEKRSVVHASGSHNRELFLSEPNFHYLCTTTHGLLRKSLEIMNIFATAKNISPLFFCANTDTFSIVHRVYHQKARRHDLDVTTQNGVLSAPVCLHYLDPRPFYSEVL